MLGSMESISSISQVTSWGLINLLRYYWILPTDPWEKLKIAPPWVFSNSLAHLRSSLLRAQVCLLQRNNNSPDCFVFYPRLTDTLASPELSYMNTTIYVTRRVYETGAEFIHLRYPPSVKGGRHTNSVLAMSTKYSKSYFSFTHTKRASPL